MQDLKALFSKCSWLIHSVALALIVEPINEQRAAGRAYAAVGLLLMLTPIGLFWWLRRRDIRTATQMLAKINPLILTFDADGLRTLEKSGAQNFMPWLGYDGFREGRKVILLREAETQQYRVVSKQTVPAQAVEQLLSEIRSRLPQIQ